VCTKERTHEDPFQDLAVGRIFSLTLSDVSSYIARDLFNHEIKKNDEFVIMWPAPPGNFWNMKLEGLAIEDTFEEMGFTSVSFLTNEYIPPEPSDFENKMMLTYMDHAWINGGTYNFNTGTLNSEEIWLNSPLVFMEGCGSCAFNLSGNSKENLFCANLLRRGALMHYGATVDASATMFDPAKMIAEEVLVSETIGDAVKTARNKIVPFRDWISHTQYDQWDVLIGDPTFNPNLKKPVIRPGSGISGLEEIDISLKQIGNTSHVINIFIPEIKKDVTISFDDSMLNKHFEAELFNYPYGNKIARAYQLNYSGYNLTSGKIIEEIYVDELDLTFALDIPEGYNITRINRVEFVNETHKIEVKGMPVFKTIYPWDDDDENEGSARASLLSAHRKALSRQRVKQRTGFCQICGVKAFGEPVVDASH